MQVAAQLELVSVALGAERTVGPVAAPVIIVGQIDPNSVKPT